MKKMVWIVDDDTNMRQATRLMFQVLGYEMREFSDGRDVTRVLLSGVSPDLLFLDLNMPEISGLDVLQFIRSRTDWKKMPILIMSSDSEDARVEQTMRMGADGYVFKPVTLEELEMAIGTAIEKRRLIYEGKTGPLVEIP
jgi:two-component system, chemotaxis family, chemotaxis protein CheY